jgi:hypothetical protein
VNVKRLLTDGRRGRGLRPAGVILFVAALTAIAAAANNWQTQTVDDDGQVGQYTSLELDSLGRPHISYFDYGNSDLKYAHWNGSAWDVKPVDSAGQVGRDTSLALDEDGDPHISYYDLLNASLKYAHRDGGVWQMETVDEGMAGEYSSLALDSQGFAHIAYYDYANNSLKYARWDGDEWLFSTVAEEAWDPPALAVDVGDRPHVVYGQYGNVIHAYWDGGVWQTQPVVDDGSAGWITALALDGAGQPRVAYLNLVDHELEYAHWDGDEWLVETVSIYGEETAVDYLALALDAAGAPHIAYTRQSLEPHTTLHYAYRDGVTWINETVDDGIAGEETLDTGFFPSIDVDEAGQPHIGYNRRIDEEHEELRYTTPAGMELPYKLYLPGVVDQSSP